MNIIAIDSGKLSISFGDVDVEINGIPYQNLMFIVRLLTLDELIRVDSFSTSSEVANLVIEDEIFNLVFDQIVGLDEDISIESIEAGVISTISGIVIEQSYSYVSNIEESLAVHEEEVTVIDQMQLLICNTYSMSYDQVSNMPLNKVFKLYSIIKRTFPHLEIKAEGTDG